MEGAIIQVSTLPIHDDTGVVIGCGLPSPLTWRFPLGAPVGTTRSPGGKRKG